MKMPESRLGRLSVIYAAALAVLIAAALIITLVMGDKIFIENELNYIERTESFENIDDIHTSLYSGTVVITTHDGDSVTVSASGHVRRSFKMSQTGSRLELKQDSGFWFTINPFSSGSELNIEIAMPKEYGGNLDINSTSGTVKVGGISADTLTISQTSGKVFFDDVYAKKLNVSSVSGNLEIKNSTIDNISSDATSGSLRIENTQSQSVYTDQTSGSTKISLTNAPTLIDISSVSGSAEITLPENIVINADFDSISGRFNNNLSTSPSAGCKINFNSTSGSLTVNPGPPINTELKVLAL